ncbi:hypothetical protein B0H10DRAFT_2196369 [Mycena sp. CBHHK59/15]|nr:hypothetical protein B0H10DRAFT_2196369 [Mycena sp. CBHHK59/15]
MANAASKHTPADREYIGSLSPHILMEFRDYLFNPTYITINAAKFLDYEWIDITLLREYVSVLGASTTRSLPILDQVHVKIEAVPPSVSTVSVKAEPDVQHVASVKTRTLHVGEREVIELLSDSEPQTEDLDSDLEVIEALQPSRSSSVPPLSDADHSSKHDSDFEELDGGSDDENSDDLMLSDTVWLDDGTSQMISGRFRPSQKVTVERMEYRNGAAAVYPIHRVRTGIVVDLSDPKYHFRDASKALVPLTTVIMDADNDSWKWLGGSASANVTFSPSEKAISCRSIRYECKGAHACDQLDAALRTAVGFELDDLAPRQAIVLAQQETRRTEGNTPEERVVLFINMIRKTKCNAIDSMGKPCRGGPILKPKPQGPSRGHELFVGCSGWTPKFQQGHRTHTISDNVNENLLARGLAGLPLADDVSKDTSPCSGIIHPHIGLKKKLCPHAHIVNGLQVQGEIKNYPCTALRWIYVPKDSSIRQVLIIHNDLGHNHPCPALSKVTFGHKDTYRRCIQANGVLGATVAKIDNAQSTKMLLAGKTPAAHAAPLHNKRAKRSILHAEKLQKYPNGLGVDAGLMDWRENYLLEAIYPGTTIISPGTVLGDDVIEQLVRERVEVAPDLRRYTRWAFGFQGSTSDLSAYGEALFRELQKIYEGHDATVEAEREQIANLPPVGSEIAPASFYAGTTRRTRSTARREPHDDDDYEEPAARGRGRGSGIRTRGGHRGVARG